MPKLWYQNVYDAAIAIVDRHQAQEHELKQTWNLILGLIDP
jgi:hypothetical protein